MRTLVIDGTNLFIIHYTANPSVDINGNPCGGVSGVLRSIQGMISTIKPQRVIFVWDGSGGSQKKRDLFKEYKQGRKPTVVGRHYEFETAEDANANRKWQQSTLMTLMDHMPILQIVSSGCEADDVISYIVNNAAYFEHQSSVIVSCDKDLYQLLRDKVIIYNPMSKKLIDTKSLIEEHGIHPNNWLLFKSINGDNSDNVPGVKGFGPKTICKLFDMKNDKVIEPDFIGSLNLNEQTEKLAPKYKILQENLDTIKRNYSLMSLSDAHLSFTEKDRLTQLIKSFVPRYNKKSLYVDITRLGGLGINQIFFSSLGALLKK